MQNLDESIIDRMEKSTQGVILRMQRIHLPIVLRELLFLKL